MSWHKDHKGKSSTMRIIAMFSTVTGCVAVLAGGVALFMQIPDAVQFAAIGAGMTGIGEIAKLVQAKGER